MKRLELFGLCGSHVRPSAPRLHLEMAYLREAREDVAGAVEHRGKALSDCGGVLPKMPSVTQLKWLSLVSGPICDL